MPRLTSRLTSAWDGAATSIVSVPSGRLERDIRRLAKPAFCTARNRRFASLTFHWRFSLGMGSPKRTAFICSQNHVYFVNITLCRFFNIAHKLGMADKLCLLFDPVL